jgi:hemerythrin
MITWNDSFSVKVKEIDDQHKNLVDSINNLEASMKAGKGKEIIEKVLQELADYTQYHFSTEEKYMNKFGYSGYQQHKLEHDNFIKKAVEFQRDFKAARLGTVISVSDFLQRWLSKHILNTDKEYSTVFNENGLK